jgi:hypothetical protein
MRAGVMGYGVHHDVFPGAELNQFEPAYSGEDRERGDDRDWKILPS